MSQHGTTYLPLRPPSILPPPLLTYPHIGKIRVAGSLITVRGKQGIPAQIKTHSLCIILTGGVESVPNVNIEYMWKIYVENSMYVANV